MVTMLQFLLAFPLLLWFLPGIFSCLHCDRRFLDSVATLLKETLPVNISGRDTLIERHIQALADLHGTFLQKNYERVLDVRGMMSLRSGIINQLRDNKRQQWKGVFLWQLSMYHLRVSLRKQMKQTLEQFADLVERDLLVAPYSPCLMTSPFHSASCPRERRIGESPGRRQACSEDCTVIEGPVLDCWTCLRIAAQCFDGELCGVEDRRIAEHKEINLYLFLVCEFVLLSSVMLVYLVCFKHKKKMLQKALAS